MTTLLDVPASSKAAFFCPILAGRQCRRLQQCTTSGKRLPGGAGPHLPVGFIKLTEGSQPVQLGHQIPKAIDKGVRPTLPCLTACSPRARE